LESEHYRLASIKPTFSGLRFWGKMTLPTDSRKIVAQRVKLEMHVVVLAGSRIV
jgi:hypothetical protein